MISFLRSFRNSPQLFLLEKTIKNGYLIGYNDNSNYYTSFKPIIKSDLNFDIDSILDKKNILDTGLISLHKIQKSKNKIKDLYNKLNLDLKKKLIVSILHPETWNDKNH